MFFVQISPEANVILRFDIHFEMQLKLGEETEHSSVPGFPVLNYSLIDWLIEMHLPRPVAERLQCNRALQSLVSLQRVLSSALINMSFVQLILCVYLLVEYEISRYLTYTVIEESTDVQSVQSLGNQTSPGDF